MLIYDQSDFFELVVSGKIQEQSVDLCFTGPPRRILDNDLCLFFGVLNRIMKRDGTLLLHQPATYANEVGYYYNGIQSDWHLEGKHFFRSKSYQDDEKMMVSVFRHSESSSPSPTLNRFVEISDSDEMYQPVVPGPTYKMFRCGYKRIPTHQCEFCPAFVRLFIETYTSAGMTVLDPFCGTGTVPGEASKLGRIGIGVDIRPVENIHSDYKVFLDA